MSESEKHSEGVQVAAVTSRQCGMCGKALRSDEVARVVNDKPYCQTCVESDGFFQVLAQEHGKEIAELRGKIKPKKVRNKRLVMLIVGLVIIAAEIVYLLFFLPPIPRGRHLAYQGSAVESAGGLEECIENMWKISTAVQRYHENTGTYPESLELLVPEYLDKVPVCPLSQVPYEYYRTEDGCFWQCPSPHEHGVGSIQCDSLGGPPMVFRQPHEREGER